MRTIFCLLLLISIFFLRSEQKTLTEKSNVEPFHQHAVVGPEKARPREKRQYYGGYGSGYGYGYGYNYPSYYPSYSSYNYGSYYPSYSYGSYYPSYSYGYSGYPCSSCSYGGYSGYGYY